jgi:polyferredoxin
MRTSKTKTAKNMMLKVLIVLSILAFSILLGTSEWEEALGYDMASALMFILMLSLYIVILILLMFTK